VKNFHTTISKVKSLAPTPLLHTTPLLHMTPLLHSISEFLQDYDFIEFALVFGSMANQTDHFLSDVDIAIYTDRDIDLMTLGEMVGGLEGLAKSKVDFVLLKNLYQKNPLLSYNIATNHHLLLCRNEEIYIDFKAKSYMYYFDFEPTLQMFNEAFSQRIANGKFGKI